MSRKLTYEEVKGFIENNGCKLISEEYVDIHTKLKIQCSCGEIFEKDFTHFKDKNQRQCKKCGIEITKTKQKLTYEEVKGFIEDNGCKLISEEYVNAYTKLKIKCSCGEMFEKSFSKFKNRNQRQCKKCAIAKVSGENNYNYNPNLTDEEREFGRLIPNYGEFIKKTYKRDNYTCQCCGQKSGKLNAHHLNGYSWDKEHRTTPINGVTLCKKCHTEFHSIYGKGNNTIIQFRDFIRNKYLQTKDPKYLTVLKDIDIRITLLVDNSTLSKEII